MKETDFLRRSLEETLVKFGVKKNRRSDAAKEKIIADLAKEFVAWCPHGKIVPIGSYRLGVHSEDSDIDLVCVAPLDWERKRFQEDFFQRLSSLHFVNYCYGVFRTKVPVVKLIIKNTKVDLLYINTNQSLESIVPESLDEANLLGVNAIKNNEMVLRLVPDAENFRMLLKTIRLWSKQRGIYSGILGFLSGTSWSILCANICIMYPDLKFFELLCKFFQVYSVWDWSVAISISPEDPGFTYHSQPAFMNILTPAQPCYNTAYTLTGSGCYCIIQELSEACKIVKEITEGCALWTQLFEEARVFQNYSHFIRVTLSACTKNEFETWSGLVLSRLRFLIYELERSYPQPVVFIYNKPFRVQMKKKGFCYDYFIGVNFSQSGKVVLRAPIERFSKDLNDAKTSQGSSLRISFAARKDLPIGEAQF